MRYPHRRFLLYLISRKLNDFEIMAECESKELMTPNDVSIARLRKELGTIPSCWKADLKRSNIKFRRWLRDKGFLSMWKGTQGTQEAVGIVMFQEPLRRTIESLTLVNSDFDACLEALGSRFEASCLPSVDGLKQFCRYFWDMSHMTPQDILAYTEVAENRKDLKPALRGELATTYGILGLKQRVEDEEFYDNFIAYANQQVAFARRDWFLHNGAQSAGTAAVAKVGLEFTRERREMGALAGSAQEDLRKQARAFRMRMIQADPIPSIDDLLAEEELEKERENVIDVEFSDEKVSRLPVQEESS